MDGPNAWLHSDILDGNYKFMDWVSQHTLDLAVPNSLPLMKQQPQQMTSSFNECEFKPWVPPPTQPQQQQTATNSNMAANPFMFNNIMARDPLWATMNNAQSPPPPPPPLDDDDEDDDGGNGDDGDNDGEDALYCRPTSIQLITPTYEDPASLKSKRFMQSFPPERTTDFKHVIYNLLVDNHNNGSTFVQPCSLIEDGVVRNGFFFNVDDNPEKKLPELYAMHVKKAALHLEDQNSVFIKDLYKFYLRACVELLGKYFEKRDKYTYLYAMGQEPLFVSNGSLQAAEQRIRNMKTKARRRRKTT